MKIQPVLAENIASNSLHTPQPVVLSPGSMNVAAPDHPNLEQDAHLPEAPQPASLATIKDQYGRAPSTAVGVSHYGGAGNSIFDEGRPTAGGMPTRNLNEPVVAIPQRTTTYPIGSILHLENLVSGEEQIAVVADVGNFGATGEHNTNVSLDLYNPLYESLGYPAREGRTVAVTPLYLAPPQQSYTNRLQLVQQSLNCIGGTLDPQRGWISFAEHVAAHKRSADSRDFAYHMSQNSITGVDTPEYAEMCRAITEIRHAQSHAAGS